MRGGAAGLSFTAVGTAVANATAVATVAPVATVGVVGAAGTAAATAAAAGSSVTSALEGAMAMGIAWNLGSAITGALGQAFITGPLQMKIMEVTYQMQKDHMAFVADDAKVDRDMKLDTLAAESEKQRVVQDGAARNNTAVERRKKCEDEVIVQKAVQHEHQVTKKIAEQRIGAAGIKKLFRDPRTVPFYGRPVR